MSTVDGTAVVPFGLHRDEGEALWFLDTLAVVKASTETTGGRLAIIEHRATEGAGSPLHVHHREAEWWYVVEGELRVWAGGAVIDAPAGSFVYAPADIPHTFIVVSPEARFLLGTQPAGFEAFMRACAEPAAAVDLPRGAGRPKDPTLLAAIAAQHGIEIVGPPGIPSGDLASPDPTRIR
jgi:mannose-6-phosphate isomerase-like protein (cupin superfamily)